MLSDEQIERYSRQIILPQIGGKGQEKLLRSRIFVSVSGPMQASVLYYLAAAGVGTLGVFSYPPDALLTSLASPQEPSPFHVLPRLNPDCSVRFHSEEEALIPQQLVQFYDLILSDSDFLHDACYMERRLFLYAAARGNEAWLIPCRGFEPAAPCLHCIQDPFIINSLVSPFSVISALFMGAHLATEAIKQILTPLPSEDVKLLHFQFLDFHSVEKIVKKSAACRFCSPACS